MATSIQVSESTLHLLKMLKEQEKAESYDDVIKNIVSQHVHVPKTMFGSMKGWRYSKEDRGDAHEL